MESFWALLLLTLFVAIFGQSLLLLWRRRRLPPGPAYFPLIGNLLWLRNPIVNIEYVLRRLYHQYGPIVTIHVGSRPMIFVFDRSLAHKFLVQNGANFASRPAERVGLRLINNNRRTISNSTYGPTWLLLRRNLVTEFLSASSVKVYSRARRWALSVLLENIRLQAKEKNGEVVVKDTFQFAMFSLLVFMCFGEKLEEKNVREIEEIERGLLSLFWKLEVFGFLPGIGKYVLPGTWKTLMRLLKRESDVQLPLIASRRARKDNQGRLPEDDGDNFQYCYVDALLGIELPEEKGRKMTDVEIQGFCTEFIQAGTDTTSTALQWIMANIVKKPEVQVRLSKEIDGVVARWAEIEEDDLHRMPYLKAVIMEGLRRHPPGHMILPHAVMEDVAVDGYVIPKNVEVNFMVADMAWDEEVWTEPLEFKPERFLQGGEGERVDVTCSKEVRMMPFGAGRRICPGINLALLHLEYFVANLVREFDWKTVGSQEIDLSEKAMFTTVMKYPLRALVSPRFSCN